MAIASQTTEYDVSLQTQLDINRASVCQALGYSLDLIIKDMTMFDGLKLTLFYMEGMVDSHFLHDMITNPIMRQKQSDSVVLFESQENKLHYLKDEVLTASDTAVVTTLETLLTQLLLGDAIILVDGYAEGIRIGVQGQEERSVSEPQTQSVVRGPMESFTENIRTNTSLIRRKIRNPNLWLESQKIGRVTKTQVSMMYIQNIASDTIVNEVRIRLNQIDIDGILESGYIEEFIQDRTLTPFATVFNSERPDTIAAGLLEGRVAILVDGTPFVLLVPALFVHFFQSSEDYYQRFDIATLLRLLRYISFFITMFAPSFYIAISTFHQEMLPTNLLINLAAQREGVPFPAFIEAMLMEITYEILREAGVRMPRTVGQAVSIVGTLVIGQSAVQAGIISAVMVIIVSITAISSYVIPASSMSITVRMLRFVFMALAASFGVYGIMIGVIGLILHLCKLRSFSFPYMSSFAPLNIKDQKDTLFRLPWPMMFTRPHCINTKNKYRQKPKSET
ncbi:spore germination protein KA [Paenibacillus sp. 1_12]|uniref:spore germination protein n=1 Tax=Paenibacillus sp. 1_12 TaxID=1566278 RepID=UPI0008F3FFE6|nr:spore germination protein [Paenibacillus sp. 1_12]SFM08538.1 spore germination protein KA [Paenibacillus sp. 1_12]